MLAEDRILVIKLSALGDLFHAVPIAARLSEAFQMPVDWVTQPEYTSLVALHQQVDRVFAYPRKGTASDWKSFVRELREQRYALAVDLQGLLKSGICLGLCRATRKIAPSHSREGAGFFAREQATATAKSAHALDRLCDTLRYLEIEPEPLHYPLAFPAILLEGFEGNTVAFATQSRWPAKDWPRERFVELGKRIQQELGKRICILGGKDEQERGELLCREIGGECRNFCGHFPLLHLGSVLQQMDLLVSNDSGPMHFAAAVGTPLVALFGPTDPARTGPWGEGHAVLRAEPGPEGYPDHRSYKDPASRVWMERLDVETVFAAVKQQLQRAGV